MPTTALQLATNTEGLEHLDLVIIRASEMLANAASVDEVKQILDQAVALRAYVASINAGRSAENHAREIVLRAERRFGEIVDNQLPVQTQRGGVKPKVRSAGGESLIERKSDSDDDEPEVTPRAAALASLGVSALDVSRCRKLASVPQAVFENHLSRVKARGEKLTRTGTIAAVSDDAGHDGNAWGTPPRILAAVRKVFGGEIDLDPASNDRAQRIVGAKTYYTVKDDGLARTWKGRVFVNPPYEQPAVTRFCEKFIAEHQAGRMTKGIILLNASTDTAWYHMLASRFPVCHTLGRIGFLLPDGRQVDGNRVGQAFFAAGCGTDFARVFEDTEDPIGIVMQRVGLR